DGTFAPAATYPATVSRIALGDLDGDDRLDVVGTSGLDVGVLLGIAGGGLGSQTTYQTGNTKHRIVFADLDRDGALDFAVSRGAPNAVGVWLATATGRCAPRRSTASEAQHRRRSRPEWRLPTSITTVATTCSPPHSPKA